MYSSKFHDLNQKFQQSSQTTKVMDNITKESILPKNGKINPNTPPIAPKNH